MTNAWIYCPHSVSRNEWHYIIRWTCDLSLPERRWIILQFEVLPLRWRHNERDYVSNHRGFDCLPFVQVYQRKHQSSASLAFVMGNSLVTGEFRGTLSAFSNGQRKLIRNSTIQWNFKISCDTWFPEISRMLFSRHVWPQWELIFIV